MGKVRSVLYRGDEEVLRWEKDAGRLTAQEFMAECDEALKGYSWTVAPVKFLKAEGEDWLTVYPYSDMHWGMYCWQPEVGKSWDLSVAEEELNEAADRLLALSPPSKTAVILGGGDQLHADNNDNETLRGRNKLQVDGRYPKVFGAVCRFFVRRIDAALCKHKFVHVRILQGNHDQHSAIALAFYLSAYYRNDPRAFVSTDPSAFWWFRFGRTFLGATHGHMAKAKQMPAIMAARRYKDWGASTHRYIHTFHLHRGAQIMTEDAGAIVEVHAVPIPKDAWSFDSGFLSNRSMQSITYDKVSGEIARSRVSLEN